CHPHATTAPAHDTARPGCHPAPWRTQSARRYGTDACSSLSPAYGSPPARLPALRVYIADRRYGRAPYHTWRSAANAACRREAAGKARVRLVETPGASNAAARLAACHRESPVLGIVPQDEKSSCGAKGALHAALC